MAGLLVVAALGAALALWWRSGTAPATPTRAGGSGAGTMPAPAGRILEPQETAFATYAGSGTCRECHAQETAAWAASNHGMAERLPDATLDEAAFVPARTFVDGAYTNAVRKTDGGYELTLTGADGRPETHRVARVIGHDPLRQFLVEAPGGRWQTLEASWDPLTNEWFNVYGTENRRHGEWGHWTGRGMNWNSMCGTCHNTRFRKNYDPSTDTFASAMAERTVGCESCHGPMKDHVDWQRAWSGSGKKDPTLKTVTASQHMETCAPCHARRSELTGETLAGASFWDHYLLAIVDETDTFYPDGQVWEEDYEYAPFLGSRMHAAGVTCLDCHEPHSGNPRKSGNDLCMTCHNGSRTGSPVIDPVKHSFHAPESSGNQCVNCHMPQTWYMQRHRRHDHGFTSPDPLLTVELGIPNACNRCHTDRDARWAAEAAERWYGTRLDRPARQRTRALAAARRGQDASVTALLRLLETPETPYWKAAALALLEPWVGRTNVAQAFHRQLSHDHPLVRARAAQGLGDLAEAGDATAAARLAEAQKDPVRAVRIAAAWGSRSRLSGDQLAAQELRHMLENNADQPQGQAQLAVWEAARGRLPSALAHYERALAWDPGATALRYDYAVALSSAGRATDALEQTREVARREPRSAEAHYRMALAWNEVGDFVQAVAALEAAVRLDPRHGRALYNLGLAHHSAGRIDAALGALQQAGEASPTDPRPAYARATILFEQGRRDEARAAAREALQREPRFEPARQLLDAVGP